MTHDLQIPFNRTWLSGNEVECVTEAIRSGHLSGDGRYTAKCQSLLEEDLGVAKVLLTTSCTHALEMAALLLDVQPGDEVIVPSFAFVSTANAFVLRGAKPVFIDIRRDTFNLDETQLERLISARTKAIVPIYYAGIACEMDSILKIADHHGIAVVEDAAQGLFAKYRGRHLGTFGCLAATSFHETKNFSCGEGGALMINNDRHIRRAEIIREKGTNRSRFFRGEVDKYTWMDLGSSYLPSDILAAFLYAQLKAKEQIQDMRRQVWQHYSEHLQSWARSAGVQLADVPAECEQPYHMFHMLMPSLEKRRALMAHLKERGISTASHYPPLHLSEMGGRYGGKPGDCPVTEDVSARLIRLPFFNGLSEGELAYVVDAVKQFDVS